MKAKLFAQPSLATKAIPAFISDNGRPLVSFPSFPGALPSRRQWCLLCGVQREGKWVFKVLTWWWRWK